MSGDLIQTYLDTTESSLLKQIFSYRSLSTLAFNFFLVNSVLISRSLLDIVNQLFRSGFPIENTTTNNNNDNNRLYVRCILNRVLQELVIFVIRVGPRHCSPSSGHTAMRMFPLSVSVTVQLCSGS